MGRIRGLIVGVAAAVALAGCATPSSGPVPAAPTRTRPAPPTDEAVPCTTGDLRASLGTPDRNGDSVFRNLVLTNIGAHSCTMRGFPQVSYVAGDDRHPVGPPAEEVGEAGPEVAVGVGRTATSSLRLVDVAAYDAAACRPTRVRGLRVAPPGADPAGPALFVPLDGTGCAGSPQPSALRVRTLTAR